MPLTWLNCILSRRYAVTVMGDPIPCPAACPKAESLSADGGAVPGDAAEASPAPHNAEPTTESHNGQDLDAAIAAETTACDKAAPAHAGSAVSPYHADHAGDNTGPFLFLANNPSLIDPLLIYAQLAALKPLVVLRQEQGPALRMFAGAAEILILPPAQDGCVHSTDSPAEDVDSQLAAHAAQEALDDAEHSALTRVAEALGQGRSVLMWPSPHVQRTGYECVPPHNCAFSLLQLLRERGQHLPELFLVRTEGLWGSRFSWYRGQAPSFGATLWAQIPALLLGPFLKRRPVRLVMRRHRLNPQNLHQGSFQSILNAWFGAGHEGALLVPRLPLRRIHCMPLEVLPQAEACAAVRAALQADTVPTEEKAHEAAQAAASSQAEGHSLMSDTKPSPLATGAGSKASPLPEKAASVPQGAAPEAHLAAASQSPHMSSRAESGPESALAGMQPDAESSDPAQPAAAPNTPLADISPAVPRTPPLLPVQHALTRQGSVTDASYGHHFSRRTLLGLAKAIGTLIGPVPATRIGMSLPCGTGAMATYIGILDCTLENDRVPVLLDPDMSPEQLAQCAEETGITHVVTSRTFNGRGLPPNTQAIYLEDITPAQVMRGSALSFMGFAGTTEVDSLAAIICSGQGHSASAQPADSAEIQPLLLRHQELMTALHELITHLSAPPLNAHSLSILGCLPPHSPLGLLVNVVLPLTCGVPIVTVNAAKNAAVLARSAENHSVNFFTGSPDSMRKLLHEARSHLPFRYVLLSQEPCPPELLALIPRACPHARIFSADMHGNIVLL